MSELKEQIEKMARKYMSSGRTIGGGDAGWIKAAYIDGINDYIKLLKQANEVNKEQDKALNKHIVSGSLPTNEELQPFLYWLFHEADRIWVEQKLGWRENAIEEMYEVYKKRQ